MSDNLREAVNEWIDQTVVVNDDGAWLNADELRAILAAHPDETSDGCVKSAPYYWLECKGCGEKSTKHSDFTAWADPETAIEEATCSDWVGRDGEYFCPDCQFDDSEAAS